MNLNNDPYEMANLIKKGGFAWRRIFAKVQNLVEHWQELAANELKGDVVISQPQRISPITGSVLGKEFKIHLTPTFKGQALHAELIVTSNSPHALAEFEVGRVLMDVNGDIFTPDLEAILGAEDNLYSFTLFTNLMSQVLQAETPTPRP